jgi:hypothetical protein
MQRPEVFDDPRNPRRVRPDTRCDRCRRVPTCTPAAADLLGRVVAVRDLDHQRFTLPAWLWHGYLGPGKTTLLTSQCKSGKTTLVTLLLARMEHAGQLAGSPVAPGRAFVISDESEPD